MTKDKEELVSKIIEKNELFISAERLKSCGLNTYDIGLLLFQQEYDEMVEVAGIVPERVLCLFSALSFHKLTTYIPKEYNVAILRTMRKPVLPSYPPIRIVYVSKQRFDTGIIEV